eukprot:PITA_17862
MPSRHKYHLVKVEAREDHILEEEEEVHKEVEEASVQAPMEEATFKIQVKAQAKIKHKVIVKEEKWVAAMEEEIKVIERNETWELVSLPKGKHVIGVKWVYKTKSNIDGKIERHKARLVVKGYKQQHGRNYAEMLTPVAWMETMHAVVAIATQHK